MNNCKSNQKSDETRAKGNEKFSQRSFFDAMTMYNESLCFAESGTAHLGLVYANRSAVYFENKLYEKCINNIKLARENHYPENNLELLKKREDKCTEALKRRRDENSISGRSSQLKLTGLGNKKIPFISDCLELKSDSKFGRYIVTNRSLKVGDVLAIEEPFSKILRGRFIYQRCACCFKDNLLDLIPCTGCIKAMFCSQECVKISLETFHKFECPMFNRTSSLDSSTMQMALRTFFVSLSYFDDSVGNLQEFLDENQISCTIFDGDVKNKKLNVLALNSLIFDEKIVVNETFFEEMFNASHDLMKLWSTHSSFIRKFLIKQIQIAEMNYHEIYTWPLKKGGLLDAEVENVKDTLAYKRQLVSSGTGSYLFCSLLNHNCAANVVRVFENEKMIVIVQRPISKGEQIFDNYGFSFTNVAKNDRQSQLMKQYKFRCSCKACEKNWPIMPKLEIFDKALLNKAKKYCRELGLEEVNHKKAYSNYKELCEILEKSKTEFPSLEKCSLMESAAAYLEITSKPQIQF